MSESSGDELANLCDEELEAEEEYEVFQRSVSDKISLDYSELDDDELVMRPS